LLFSNCSENKKTNSNTTDNTVVFATQLPKKINETSGLEYFDGQLITHNDSGDDALLYGFSKTGALLETYVVEDAENHDWEDIAMDDRYLYISDSGNNFGNRKNLKIIITDPAVGFEKVGVINFSYALQDDFNKRKKHPYDAEALMAVNDHLVLFSKNRAALTTELYLLPKQPGDYQLSAIKSFDAQALITGGDYKQALQLAALVGYRADGTQYLFILQDFDLNGLDQVKMQRIELPLEGKQIEAIKIIDAHTFWITSEDEGIGHPMLYKVQY
jgi:hypothetical protein